MQGLELFAVRGVGVGLGVSCHLGHLTAGSFSAGCRFSGSYGHAAGDAEEPGRERLATADGRGFFNQDQEGGLEGVFGGVGVGESMPADGPDQGAVAGDQG